MSLGGYLTAGTGMLSKMSASASSFCQIRKFALFTFFMTLNREQAMALRTSSLERWWLRPHVLMRSLKR